MAKKRKEKVCRNTLGQNSLHFFLRHKREKNGEEKKLFAEHFFFLARYQLLPREMLEWWLPKKCTNMKGNMGGGGGKCCLELLQSLW